MKRSAPALISLLVGLAGCAALSGPYREYEIRFEDDSQPALGPSPSTEELINAAAWLIRHKLDMPFPPVIKAYVYVNQATLVDGLVKLAGDSSDEAWDRGRYAAGVAARAGLFLRGDYLAHMHLVGRSIKVTMKPPDGERATLLEITDWDYNWQETYFLKEPFTFKQGTKFNVEAVYDNSSKNPSNPFNPPQWVRFGEQTDNEMCFVFLGVTNDDTTSRRFRFRAEGFSRRLRPQSRDEKK